MEYKTLLAERHTDRDSGYRLRHVKSETEYFRPHDHDYYELFLVLSGTATHIVAEQRTQVSAGDLIFIRDFDVHDYTEYRGEFEFLNFAFDKDTFISLRSFLGNDKDFDVLISASLPPSVSLSEREADKLRLKFAELLTATGEDTVRRRARARNLLSEIFIDYLFPSDDCKCAPVWLRNAYSQMQKPENFLIGVKRFTELCQRTREHCARALSKHYRITPSEFINELRLNYASGLLQNSNLSVSEICFEAGFNNISHFYTIFRKKHGCTPKEYTKKH